MTSPLFPPSPPGLANFAAGQNLEALVAVRALARGELRESVYLWGPAGGGKTHLLRAAVEEARGGGMSAVLFSPEVKTESQLHSGTEPRSQPESESDSESPPESGAESESVPDPDAQTQRESEWVPAFAGKDPVAGTDSVAGKSSESESQPRSELQPPSESSFRLRQPFPGLLALDNAESLCAEDEVALFDWFNRPRDSCFVIVAGRLPPSELPLRPELQTRIGGGLGFRLRALSDADKSRALALFAGRRGFALPDGIAERMLERLPRDMAKLTSALSDLDSFLTSERKQLTDRTLREWLRSRGEHFFQNAHAE